MIEPEYTVDALVRQARDLAAERTDGSVAALYLLVERMRPVMRALADELAAMQERAEDLAIDVLERDLRRE